MDEGMACRKNEDAWLLKGAIVANPGTGLWGRRDILIVDDRVEVVATDISQHHVLRDYGEEPRIVNLSGFWIWPGLIDLHVHFREPGYTHKETVTTGGAAALNGGYSCVVCEPNTDPPLAKVSIIENMAEKADQDTPVRVRFKAAMSSGRKGQQPADVERLARVSEVVALSDDGDPIVDVDLMEQVCRRSAAVGLPVCPHCEDSRRSREAYDSGVDPGFSVGAWKKNEASYIERDAQLAVKWGVPAHFSHVSLAESLEVVQKLKRDNPGVPLTLEVAPHHLLLDEESELEEEAGKVNPPLRTPEDRKALCDALVAGKIDAIASDHAPHQRQEKQDGASGFIGVETTLPLILTHFVHKGLLAPVEAAGLMSSRPAQILGLPGGSVMSGSLADLVIIDPELDWEIHAGDMLSRSQNTPFDGHSVKGRAVGVMIDGEMVSARDSLKSRIYSK